MIEKKEYIACIERLNEICAKYELRTLVDDNNRIKSEVDNFVVHILLMGGFSAGKSAFLNAITSKAVLPENQGEETAIAMELLYDDREYIEAISKEGIDRYDLSDIDNILSEKYEHLKVHMDSEFLGKIPGVRLVDMPGLDSKVERHNKAIMQYIGNGNAYLLCVDCEDGVLKPSRSDFIKEVKQYKNSLVLAITKCDKKPVSQIERIACSIQDSAEMAFQEKIKTFKVSVFDEDIEEEALKIIDAFDVQSLFEQAFEKQISNNLFLCIKSLTNIKNTSEFSGKEIDKEIKKIELSKIELDNKLKSEESKLDNRILKEVKPNILQDLEIQLINNLSKLTSSAMVNSEAFSRTVNNIVRPILITSTQQYVEKSFVEFIDEIEIVKDFDVFFTDNILEQYNDFSQKWNTILSRNRNADGTYKAVFGTLAVLTDVIAPWVEVVILFLPQIVGMFSGWLEKKQENSVKNSIEAEIIPQIISKIEEMLDTELMQAKDIMLKDIKEKYNIAFESKAESIQKLQNEKEKKQIEYDDFLGEINDDIETIEELMSVIS